MSLSGVLARPGLALRTPRGAAQLVCVGRDWGGGFWSFQQPIRWVGAGWDVFHINVLGPHTPREMHAEQRKPRCAGNFLKPGRCPTQWLHVSMSPLETTNGLIPCPPPPPDADPWPQRSNRQWEWRGGFQLQKICKDFLRPATWPLWAAVASSDPRRRHMRKCYQMPDVIIPV